MPRLLPALLLLLGLAGPAAAQPITGRPADSLLHRPALQALVEAQVQRDAGPLVTALASDDPAVRARAAFALASVQDTAAVPALIDLLDDPDPAVRADAAFALGQMPGDVPTEALFAVLAHDESPAVMRAAVEAIGKQGDEGDLVRLVSLQLPAAVEARRALAVAHFAMRGVHADPAVRYLTQMLGSNDPSVRRQAAYYFARSAETEPWMSYVAAVREHLDALRPGDPSAAYLLRGLGRLGRPQDAGRVAEWLAEAEDWRTRAEAARAAAALSTNPDVRAALFAALDDPSEHVALAAAGTLAQFEAWTNAETRALRTWIEDHPEAWRITAPLLAAVARQGDETFVLENVESFRLSPDELPYIRSLSALAIVSRTDALDRLVEAAEDEDVRVSYAALQALADRWQRDRLSADLVPLYFDVFSNALRRRDLATAYASAPLLADTLFRELGNVDVLGEVYESLRTPDDIEPMTAILDALGATGDSTAAVLLEKAVTHPHPVVRMTAAEALRELTGEAPSELVEGPAGEAAARMPDWDYLAALGERPRLVLTTEAGDVVIEMVTEQAPLTVQTLAQFAEEGRFDGVPFHRVVPNFVIQGGDFARGDGFGGPGFSIRSEFTRIPYRRGTAGMASAGKDTEGSQYFVTHSMQPHLDGRYTAFGVVVDGMEVVDQIQAGHPVLEAHVIRVTSDE